MLRSKLLDFVPYPSGPVQECSGQFVMPDCIGADLGDFENWCMEAFIQRTGMKPGGKNWIILERDLSVPKEGYCLHISETGVVIRASSENGVVWALTTVAILAENQKLPCCVVEDAPRYPHRGLNLDCARHFFPADEVKKVIEEISLAKMNVLHWHLSDDQGWRIESKRFPRLQEISGQFFTQEEIREIVEYARVRGVEIIPEIDLPGHTSSILAAYPMYSCSGKEISLATGGGIYPVILCPGKEETFSFVRELLEEILPLFQGKRFHIGGDEAPKSEWKKCPDCARRMEEQGIGDFEGLQGYFTCRVVEILKEYGKQPICWNEILMSENWTKDMQIQYWTLQHRNTMEKFAQAGGHWIYSDMFELYFDYPYSMTPMKKVYKTIPHLGKHQVSDNEGLLGLEACLWSEHIKESEQLEKLLFPRIYALAELGWCGMRNYREFEMRLKVFLSKGVHGSLRYTPESWWNPKGRARRKEAIDYFTSINSGMSEEVKNQTVEATAPNREFAQSFMSKFFRPLDIPFLLKTMVKK